MNPIMIAWYFIKQITSTKTGLYIVIGLIAICGVFYAGYWTCDSVKEKERLESIERAIVEANETARQDAEIFADREDVRVEVRTVYKTIYREAENVQTDCDDLGAEFVSVFNSATESGKAATN